MRRFRPNAAHAAGSGRRCTTIRTLLSDRVFLGAVLNQGFLYAALFAYLAGSTFVLQDIYGLSPLGYALAFGLNSAGFMTFGYLAGRAAERWSIAGTLAIGILVAGARRARSARRRASSPMPLWVVIVSLFLLAAGVAISSPPATTLALVEYPQMAGTASSLLGMVRFGFGGIAAPLVGVAGALSILPLGIVTTVAVLLAGAAYLLCSPAGPDPSPHRRRRRVDPHSCQFCQVRRHHHASESPCTPPATSGSKTATNPVILEPTDAIIRLSASCICGSDLWPYRGAEPLFVTPQPMGHEYVGVVTEIGADVKNVKVGDFVVGSFVASDNTCEICQAGYQSRCVHNVMMGAIGTQSEYARIPLADGTLVATPGQPDADLIPSLLAASDVLGTGWFAAVAAEAGPGKTVAVVGDGAVGLLGILAARELGAERIIAMSRHADRQALAREFGATDIVEERGDAGVAKIKELTDGLGAHSRDRSRRHPGVDGCRRSAPPAPAATSATSASRTTSPSTGSNCSSPACTCTADPPRCAGSCPS